MVVEQVRAEAGADVSAYGLRCLLCGHEYASRAADVCQRRCPLCQDGEPEVALDEI
jgi:Zn finger protein HypA/HybF involved in hydrogenase expression